MPRPGTTTARGYGWAHQQEAARLKREMRDGQPCARCGRPMYRSQLRRIHADHHSRPRVLGGTLPDALSHDTCNLRHGARLGNALRGRRRRGGHPAPRQPLPRW